MQDPCLTLCRNHSISLFSLIQGPHSAHSILLFNPVKLQLFQYTSTQPHAGSPFTCNLTVDDFNPNVDKTHKSEGSHKQSMYPTVFLNNMMISINIPPLSLMQAHHLHVI